jgi:hypothetical protein
MVQVQMPTRQPCTVSSHIFEVRNAVDGGINEKVGSNGQQLCSPICIPAPPLMGILVAASTGISQIQYLSNSINL